MGSTMHEGDGAGRDEMPRAYDAAAVEARWIARWEEAALFQADARTVRPRYAIAVPPPNVTGDLHMGHAVNVSLQDVWARYHRMTGHEVLWLPGMDHAAIATQNVIEKRLAAEGRTKEELGRVRFQEYVDDWYRRVGQTIIGQFRILGASLDYARLRFTMDDAYVRAVRTAFVRYYDKGWLYRGPRIVNWCPRCQSAISDLEIDWKTQEDSLYQVRYPLEGTEDSLVVATVRPETMLADVALAVHPATERYRRAVGLRAILPLVGRRLPVIADEAVDRSFGTGVLKVTPGHDPVDYEIAQRQGLPIINAMHQDGRMNVPDLPDYDGLPTAEVRSRVTRDLEAGGYLVRVDPYSHQVGHCDRCAAVLEPMVSEQWWLRMQELAAMCIRASEEGRVRWHPERFEQTYLDWLRGVRDWCVSRQLWLGHRIPVFTCPAGHAFAAVDSPEVCGECGKGPLTEDPDVLDTWFSSALWPFATLGWPEDTEDLRAFYPTNLNVTDRGIINLWVSRMIFSGLEFLGAVPFSDVVVHATILTKDGRRMSKSLGTGIDPRRVIEAYGTDALRAWATQVALSSQDVRYDEGRIEGFRRFANKLWNATRLVLLHIGDEPARTLPPPDRLGLMDRWILDQLAATVETVTEAIDGHLLTGAVSSLHRFVWHDFCDWYLESAKDRIRMGSDDATGVCLHVLDVVLRLLHPFMPFVTEELWRRLPGPRDYLVRTEWPRAEAPLRDTAAQQWAQELIEAVEEIRRARSAAGAPARGGLLAFEGNVDSEIRHLTAELAFVQLVPALEGPGIALTSLPARLQLPAAQVAAQSSRERERLGKELARVESKLRSPQFLERAPRSAVDETRARREQLVAALRRLESGERDT